MVLIEIFDFTPAQWAIFKPQILHICRLQNGYITYDDEMFGLIWGRISEDRQELAQNKVIHYFEQIPWQHEYEQELAEKGVQKLSAAEKARAKQTMRKAEILPQFLFDSKQYDQLSALLNDPLIRADIPAGDVNYLEKRIREKTKK